VERLLQRGDPLACTPLADVVRRKEPPDKSLLDLAHALAQ